MCSGSRTKRPVTQSLKAMTFTLAPRPMSTTPALFGFVALDLSDTERYYGVCATPDAARDNAAQYLDDASDLDVLPATVTFFEAACEDSDMLPASDWHVTRVNGRQVVDLRI
jgi:hypothetical protein